MFLLGRKDNPKLCLYPEITFASRIGDEARKVLTGLSRGTSGRVINDLADRKVWVKELGERVVISTEES